MLSLQDEIHTSILLLELIIANYGSFISHRSKVCSVASQ